MVVKIAPRETARESVDFLAVSVNVGISTKQIENLLKIYTESGNYATL